MFGVRTAVRTTLVDVNPLEYFPAVLERINTHPASRNRRAALWSLARAKDESEAGMKQDSYSGTFTKWAEPLLRLVADAPRSAKTSALEIAATTWNAVTLEDAGVAPGAIAEMKERLAQLPPPGADLFGAIVTELIESRRTQFADSKWTIAKRQLRGTGEKIRVFLQANAIPTP